MTIEIKLTFRGQIKAPFLQSGLEMEMLGLDQSALRNHLGQWIISGNLIEGNLRHLADWCFCAAGTEEIHFGANGGCKLTRNEKDAIFGKEGENGRADLKLFDAPILDREDGKEITSSGHFVQRVGHDEDTGAAKEGAIFVTEQFFGDGDTIHFVGNGRCFAGSEQDTRRIIEFLTLLASMVPMIGAQKTAGWGRLEKLVFDLTKAVAFEFPEPQRQGNTNYELRLGCTLPLLVSPRLLSGNNGPYGHAPDGNVFESLDHIPGNVIFGAIDDLLRLAGVADENDFIDLKKVLTIRHAFPALENVSRPEPASFAERREKDGLELSRDDWKEDGVSKDGLAWPVLPEKVFRTRTAINTETLGPEAEKIFTHILLSPEGREWVGSLSIPDACNASIQNAFDRLRAWLGTNGLPRVGKSAVPMSCKFIQQNHTPLTPKGNKFNIRLITDAWIIQGPNNAQKDYASYFKGLDSSLKLEDFQAAQSWDSTPKFSRRDDRREWLLTKAGSVFTLTGSGAVLRENASPHLPTADPGQNFSSCPFQPENGYGEYVLEGAS